MGMGNIGFMLKTISKKANEMGRDIQLLNGELEDRRNKFGSDDKDALSVLSLALNFLIQECQKSIDKTEEIVDNL